MDFVCLEQQNKTNDFWYLIYYIIRSKSRLPHKKYNKKYLYVNLDKFSTNYII